MTSTQDAYELYAAHARRVGAEPYTRTQWGALGSAHRTLLARLAQRA